MIESVRSPVCYGRSRPESYFPARAVPLYPMPPTVSRPDDASASGRPSAAVISIHSLRTHCSSCSLRELCLPMGLNADELQQLDAAVTSRIRLKKGTTLFHAGAPFTALYAVRLGSLKTTMAAEDGRAQVAGLPHARRHHRPRRHRRPARTAARQSPWRTAEVCVDAVRSLEALARKVPALQHNLHRLLAQRDRARPALMLLLGSMRAEERLAAVPAQPVRALSRARLLVDGVRAADDARGDRQLPRPEARDGEPAVLPLPARRPDPGAGPRGEADRPPDALRRNLATPRSPAHISGR